MATEKLSKAYAWRSGKAPPLSHTGFVQFLRVLSERLDQRGRSVLGPKSGQLADFQAWIREISPLANALQSLAPSVAKNGPNPEYPWPHQAPTEHPANDSFPLWVELSGTSRGRKMLDFVDRAITRFDQYA